MEKTKNVKKVFASVVMAIFAIVTILLLGACGPTVEKDVTKLDGIVDQVGCSQNVSDESLNSVWLIFREEPSALTAKYDGQEIEMEKSSVEDYDGAGSNVTAYQYLYSFATPVAKETYNQDAILINCKVGKTTYEFTLTTDLDLRIYQLV